MEGLKMKKNTFMVGIALMLLAGCQEDVMEENVVQPAVPGEEIQFAAVHGIFPFNENNSSRTIYGDREGDAYPIYWINGDEIGIFCPQGSSPDNTRQFDYKVVVNDETSSEGTLAKINPGENGLQWGDGKEHDFYAIYPASASEGGMSDTEVKCNIPLRQDPLRIEYENGTYTAYPNMEYAYMYAHTQVNRSTQGNNPISLSFEPLVTVLEITVNGPSSTPVTGDYQVSQISIRSNENITGDFKLTVADDPASEEDGACTAIDDGTVSNLLTIPTTYNGVPVTLKPGEKLVVKAFMLPYANPEQSTTAVTVNIVGQGSKTKILETADIQSRKVNITSLPALEGTDFYYWMSAMDGRTYFSQLSIPGSHNSYSVNERLTQGTNTIMEDYQTLTVTEQFQAGARAFSFMVGFQNQNVANNAVEVDDGGYLGTSSTNWNNDYDLYVFGGSRTNGTLTEALDAYVEMLDNAITNYKEVGPEGRECQEFIVLNIDYKQQVGSGDYNENKYREVKRWMREMERILNNYQPQSVNGIEIETNVSSTSTINDLKRKIVVFVNYQCPDLPDHEGAVEKHDVGWYEGEEYEGYTFTPSTNQKFIFLRRVYDTNSTELTNTFWGENDRDIDYAYYMTPEGTSVGINVWRQTLQRLNNPYLGNGGNFAPYAGRIDTKINIAKSFFQQAIENNAAEGTQGLNNWYINNLGGFCVVNQNLSYNPENGDSGNTVLAAHEVNSQIYNYLVDPSNNSGPVGVVLMNFFGVKRMNDVNEANMDLYGEWLPQAIIENNFRFNLKRSE